MKNYFYITLAIIFSTTLCTSAIANTAASKEDRNDKDTKEIHSFNTISISTENSDETEESIAFGSAWAWNDDVLTMLDSYTPFIFRTKKSAEVEQLKIKLNINNRGKLIGYEVLTENADKGLVERVAHVLRKMPNAQPVPGFSNYEATAFELVFTK
jgi:hypothetical protein